MLWLDVDFTLLVVTFSLIACDVTTLLCGFCFVVDCGVYFGRLLGCVGCLLLCFGGFWWLL